MSCCSCYSRGHHFVQLFQHLRKDPPQGHMKTSIQQLLRADRAVWTKIIVAADVMQQARNSSQSRNRLSPGSPTEASSTTKEWMERQTVARWQLQEQAMEQVATISREKEQRQRKGCEIQLAPKVFKHKDCVSGGPWKAPMLLFLLDAAWARQRSRVDRPSVSESQRAGSDVPNKFQKHSNKLSKFELEATAY